MITRVTDGAKSEQRPHTGRTLLVYRTSIKKRMTFFSLQSLNLSSSRPASHDESRSLQGKLQRPLTKRESDQPL